jgi:hypothetical protein
VAITLGWLEIRQQPPAESAAVAARTSSDEDFLVSTHHMFADLATGEEAES